MKTKISISYSPSSFDEFSKTVHLLASLGFAKGENDEEKVRHKEKDTLKAESPWVEFYKFKSGTRRLKANESERNLSKEEIAQKRLVELGLISKDLEFLDEVDRDKFLEFESDSNEWENEFAQIEIDPSSIQTIERTESGDFF